MGEVPVSLKSRALLMCSQFPKTLQRVYSRAIHRPSRQSLIFPGGKQSIPYNWTGEWRESQSCLFETPRPGTRGTDKEPNGPMTGCLISRHLPSASGAEVRFRIRNTRITRESRSSPPCPAGDPGTRNKVSTLSFPLLRYARREQNNKQWEKLEKGGGRDIR